MKEIKGSLVAKGKKFAIVVSRFNEFISGKLVEGAQEKCSLEFHHLIMASLAVCPNL